MVWNAMLDKTHRCGKKKGEKHSCRSTLPSTAREVNTNFHEFSKNCDIDVTSCEGIFCLFLFHFFPHLQVFLWSCAFPNCHSARPFLFLLFLFIQRSDFFIIFFFITTLHIPYTQIIFQIFFLFVWFVTICEICNDLYDLTFASHVDRWFCPTGHTFLVAFGEGFF